jgi:hypothetical protein
MQGLTLVQMLEKQRLADAAAADKGEKRLAQLCEELTKAERVLRFDSTQAALADRFRFDESGAPVQEQVDGAWVVCFPECLLL